MPSAFHSHPLSRFVRKCESIAPLSDAERQAILNLPIKVSALSARQVILCDGDTPTHCYLIVEGWACSYKMISEGRRQIVAFHIAGDIPDLRSLHIGTMDRSLGSLTGVTVALIPHDSLRDLIVRYPGIAAILWRDTLVDAGIFCEWITSLGRRTSFEHIAHLFCELYLKLRAVGLANGHGCPLPVTQNDLADALGLTSVHVNRVLQEMRSRGLISLSGRQLVISAWDEVVRVAEFDPTYLQLEMRAVE
ncbi:Crp/Fnr family transcriptional regulator [Methylobacterium gnaphalii]|uniref:Crp/Fnr family transcriptional regulator n=1 Tax=Methylobacterium gnaphalii TaxID=1010610 RepID=A0A512JR29_9HYPH|nr:Crp/Fnr family transcriptional regulator [Methylobacterium gnaphalii]GEP12399.1 Crp/Fnr family transcriptional regulator [Methylobacterium gnaphalii]GJD71179.1 Anaerobic regulatory protein [Methylobacterium gnaphalii]GLS51563.1 Crp/Fnr family transcriptional regulator [Methylobacterium gnaphalii]